MCLKLVNFFETSFFSLFASLIKNKKQKIKLSNPRLLCLWLEKLQSVEVSAPQHILRRHTVFSIIFWSWLLEIHFAFQIAKILLQVGDEEQGDVDADVVMFSPPLEKTKAIMVTCLKEIVENTQNFPRKKSSTKPKN